MIKVVSTLICALLLAGCSGSFDQNLKSWGARVLNLVPGYSAYQAFSALGDAGQERKGELTDEEEHYLGRAVAARILSAYPALENKELDQYVNLVGHVAVAHSQRPETFRGYHFQILDTEAINSLSAPGGFVFITKGLLQILPDEDALAAVLAHEVGHIARKHGLKAIDQHNLSQVLAVAGKAASSINCSEVSSQIAGAFRGAVDDVFNFLEKGYDRDQEYEADQSAVQILEPSGYDQAAIITALQQIKQANEDPKWSWIASHPSSEDRISRAQALIKAGERDQKQREKRSERFRQITQKLS